MRCVRRAPALSAFLLALLLHAPRCPACPPSTLNATAPSLQTARHRRSPPQHRQPLWESAARRRRPLDGGLQQWPRSLLSGSDDAAPGSSASDQEAEPASADGTHDASLLRFARKEDEAPFARALLPRLPITHSPFAAAWNNTAAICTAMRDEQPSDVREWIQYHRWLGFDHIFVTENHSRKRIKAALADYIGAGFVTYRTEHVPHAQLKVYNWCYETQRERFNWMAFFDVDEFLVIRTGEGLKSVLDSYKFTPGVGVHWLRFGSSGHLTRPEGGTLRSYTRCQGAPAQSTKIVANLYYMAGVANNPHTVRFWGSATSVDESMRPFPYVKSHMEHPTAAMKDPTIQRLALFHYQIKSQQDFEKKLTGGAGNGAFKTMEYFERIDQLANETSTLCKHLLRVANDCCPRKHAQDDFIFERSSNSSTSTGAVGNVVVL